MKHLRGVLTIGAAAFFLVSCSKDAEEPIPGDTPFSKGIIVINGGNFSQNNGTFSFIDRNSKAVTQNIYNLVNGQVSLPAEDGRIEGYAEAGGMGMILFDHSSVNEDQLVFVDAGTFEKWGDPIKAPAIENPRDVVAISATKAYVTNWDTFNADYSYKEGYITVVNPTGRTAGKRINVGQGPENMIYHENKVYVGRYSGGSNELTIVDTNTDEVTRSITFDSHPAPIGIDVAGKLWVKEGSRLHRINTTSNEVEKTVVAGGDPRQTVGVATLTGDKANIVFVLSSLNASWEEVGSTFKMPTTTTSDTLSVETPFVDRVFSVLSADPVSKALYAGITPSFTAAGVVRSIDTNGKLRDTLNVEISPEGFFFK